MVARKGTTRFNSCDAPAVTVDLFYSWKGRTNSPLIIIVYRPVASPDYFTVEIWSPGETTTPLASFSPPGMVAGRPSCAKCEGELFLFTPTADQTSTWRITHSHPYYEALVVENHGGGVNSDPGLYWDAGWNVDALHGCSHASRLFIVRREDPWVVWYSAFEDPFGWPQLNTFIPFADSSSPVTGMVSFGTNLVVFAEGKTSVFNINGTETEKAQVLRQNVGALTHQAMVQSADTLYFMAVDGLLEMDNAGNITMSTYVGRALERTWRDLGGVSLAGATIRIYSSKRQIWVCIPGANAIYVYDIKSQQWSTRTLETRTSKIQTIGTVETSEGEVMAVAMVSDSAEGHLLRFEYGWADWEDAGNTEVPYAVKWLGHPTPFSGFDLHRLFLEAYIVVGDCGTATFEASWIAPGQVMPASFEPTSQYRSVSLTSSETLTRVGAAKVGTAVVGNPSGQEFERQVVLGGRQRGRWLQLGVMRPLLVPATPVRVRRWRLITRAHSRKGVA
jgi:hypothetical protein